MLTRPQRTLAGAVVGIGVLALLVWLADVKLADLGRVDPGWAALAMVSYASCLICRALALKAVAPPEWTTATADWLKLTVRHQLIFVMAPSGSGDLAFPVLAKRYADLAAPEAVRMLALTRLRDVLVVCAIGAAGLLMYGVSPVLGGAVVALGAIAVLATERIAAMMFRAGARLWGETAIGRFLRACTEAPAPEFGGALLRSALIVLAWICVGASVYAAFSAVGRPLSLAEVCLVVAALNVVGALAISIGGLGVSEAGATGVLMMVGETVAGAAGIAVIARPLLLVLMVAAAVILDLIAGVLPRNAPVFDPASR